MVWSTGALLPWRQTDLEQLSRWSIVVLSHYQAQDLALRHNRVFYNLVAAILVVLQGCEGKGLQSPVTFFDFGHDGLLQVLLGGELTTLLIHSF